jgi:hypothetical protein
LAVVLDHSWVSEGRRLHTSRVHFLPLKTAAKLFSRPLPVGPAEAREPDPKADAPAAAPAELPPPPPSQEPKQKKTE